MRRHLFSPVSSGPSASQQYPSHRDSLPRADASRHIFSWDELYLQERSNYATDPSDEGTVWFEDSSAEDKILSYLTEKPQLSLPSTRFLDLGTGNGHLLFSLRDDACFEGDLVGIDYSHQSIELARQIAERRDSRGIRFAQWDMLNDEPGPWLEECGGPFDVVLDKGTFDAISLSSDLDVEGRRSCESYAGRVAPLVKDGGLLLVTSCNWTEEELRSWLESPETQFEFLESIPYPTFAFGGKQGQTVCSVVFRRT
ncbi:MAG: hypothetical protein M1833_005888 [Piccolia ochrophora]|nr:MAG: hypothetical protein M1833_005888 [Piccolia ochrophora]